jgi:peptidoglycan/xylan/chitin deacetylase (PgdA/CDA1 family)
MISPEELYRSYKMDSLKNETCLISVDDGDATYYSVVFPILKALSIPSVLFVSPQYIMQEKNFWFQRITTEVYTDFNTFILDKIVPGATKHRFLKCPVNSILKNLTIETIELLIDSFYTLGTHKEVPYMNIDKHQLIELSKSELVTLGAHTVSHPILSNEGDRVAQSQIMDSIQGIGDITGVRAEYFAYPNGIKGLDFGQREMSILELAGVKLAFSTEKRKVKYTDNLLCVPRIGISVGNIDYVLKKIRFCQYWDTIRALRGSDMETRMRKKLKPIEWHNV